VNQVSGAASGHFNLAKKELHGESVSMKRRIKMLKEEYLEGKYISWRESSIAITSTIAMRLMARGTHA
jgi:hypothetical protein